MSAAAVPAGLLREEGDRLRLQAPLRYHLIQGTMGLVLGPVAGALLALLLLACRSTSVLPPHPPMEPVLTPEAEAAPVPDPVLALITDEECVARGGTVVTEETYRHLDRRDPDGPRTPFRVCRIPSPENGKACTGKVDCGQGRCYCTGPLSRPDPQRVPDLLALDGTAGEGRCSDEPVESGAWRCLVVDGKVELQGLIVD